MAFGQTMEEKPIRSGQAVNEDGTPIVYAWQWIPLAGTNSRDNGKVKGGVRKIRLLPALDTAGQIIVVDDVEQTETETRFLAVWLDVQIEGKPAKRRAMLDWRRPFDNPYWKLVAEKTAKGSPERKAMKQMFALNVVDRSMVLFDENDQPIYANEQNEFILTAKGQFIQGNAPTGKPAPLNQVRILEQSAGQSGGKHFLQQLFDAVKGFEDGDSTVRWPHEFDLTISITGVDIETRRPIRPVANFKRLPDELLFAPRYNLVDWATAWPDEAVIALIEGADFNEVAKDYNLVLYPNLPMVEVPEAAPVEDVKPVSAETKAKVGKSSAKTKKLEDTEHEALFDD